MNYIPKTDWKTDDEVDHDHLNTLEQALADAVTSAETATATKKTADAAAQGVSDLREEANGKVTSIGQENKIYGTGPSGEDTNYPLGGSIPAANSIAYRTTDGTLTVGKPTADDHATTKKYVDDAVGKTLKIGTTATTAMAGNTTIPDATPAGTRKQLDAGTDNTVRAFSAKDIADYVKAQIAALAQPKG